VEEKMNDCPITEYRAILTVDIEDYSSRTDAEQRVLQSALMTSLDRAADAADLNREQWMRQLGGDGLMALLTPGTNVHRLLDVLVRRLDAELGSHNRLREQPAWSRIRLRLAVHAGLIYVDGESGWPGQHAVLPARLRDSTPIRAALAGRPEADLAVIVSAEVYRDYVTQGPGNPRPSEFRAVRVQEKKQSYIAYLHLPRFDIHDIAELAPYEADDKGPSDGAAPAVPEARPQAPAPAGGITAGRDVIGKMSNRVRGGGDLNIGGGSAR
jgi:class 3 adenylate cyclase